MSIIKVNLPEGALAEVEEKGIQIMKEEILRSKERLNKRFVRDLRKRFGVPRFYPDDLTALDRWYKLALAQIHVEGKEGAVSNPLGEIEKGCDGN